MEEIKRITDDEFSNLLNKVELASSGPKQVAGDNSSMEFYTLSITLLPRLLKEFREMRSKLRMEEQRSHNARACLSDAQAQLAQKDQVIKEMIEIINFYAATHNGLPNKAIICCLEEVKKIMGEG